MVVCLSVCLLERCLQDVSATVARSAAAAAATPTAAVTTNQAVTPTARHGDARTSQLIARRLGLVI